VKRGTMEMTGEVGRDVKLEKNGKLAPVATML